MIVYFDKIYNFNEKFCSHDLIANKTERFYTHIIGERLFSVGCKVCKYVGTFSKDIRTKFPNDFTLISIKFDIPGVRFFIYNKEIAINKNYTAHKKLNFNQSSNGINLETFYEKEVSKYLALL